MEKKEEQIPIDVTCREFHNKVIEELDLSRIKKSVEIFRELRISAAELEVETAALYHAKLLQNIEELNEGNQKYKDVSNVIEIDTSSQSNSIQD